MSELKRHPCYEPPTMDDWYDALEVDVYLATLPILSKECEWVKRITSMTHFETGCNRKPCNKSMGGTFCPYCGGKIVETPKA